jgi:phosphoglycerate dehydrogenase-like enzyme
MPKVRNIFRFGNGVDNVDIHAATASGDRRHQGSLPTASTKDSDNAMAVLLAVRRAISPSSTRQVLAGEWKMPDVGAESAVWRGSTLGLMGRRIPAARSCRRRSRSG